MAEYIDREATIKAFCEKCKGYYDGHCIHRGECDIDVIKNAPSADVQSAPMWISVKDRLPEKDCLYIVCRTIYPHQIVFEARWKDSKWLSVVASNQLEYITHWMPLPEPPKDGDTE